MFSFLLAIIYISFISLGLPDAILGAAWPTVRAELGVPTAAMGLISVVISAGTVTSSLLSDRLTKKLGVGVVTAASVLLTALALFGFSVSTEFWMLLVLSVPYGLGAGAVDAALNNFVALHYSSRHMSWLHCFWGVGALAGPYILSAFLVGGGDWHSGYRCVSMVQLGLTAVLFATLPLWKRRHGGSDTADGQQAEPVPLRRAVKIPGVPLVMLACLGYCGMEQTAGLWASSYLVDFRGVDAGTAARFASLFYIGITAGRFVCGFVADSLGDKKMIRIGAVTAALGVVMVLLPIKTTGLALAGLTVIGVGGAPIYPSLLHATPDNFGRENSQALVGVQMASAYMGETILPPLFGLVAQCVSISLYPVYLLALCALTAVSFERLNRKRRENADMENAKAV